MQNNKYNILVQIQVMTFNQVKYIRQCLDGILMQKTNFKFEIVIHDDASTDGTKELLRSIPINILILFTPFMK